MHTFLNDIIKFNTWANHKVVASLETCPIVPGVGVELLSHILQNNWYVMDLIEERDNGKRWYDAADYNLMQCVTEIPKLDAAYKELIVRAGEAGLEKPVTFIDSAGKTVTRKISDLIYHTHDHCTYHRGQIAKVVRQAGGEPAKTWFNRWITETNRGEF